MSVCTPARMPPGWSCRTAASLLALLSATLAVADVPRLMSYQGRLAAHGDDAVDLTIQFWSGPTTADPHDLLFAESHSGVSCAGGVFSISIGSQTAGGVPDSALDVPEVWVGLRLNEAAELTPRTRLVMVPYAARATISETLAFPGSLTPAVTTDAENRVGIGTASPLAALHVLPDPWPDGFFLGNAESGGTYLSMSVTALANGACRIQSVSAEGSAYGDLLLNPSGGHVGVGTKNAQATLHVAHDDGNPGTPGDGCLWLTGDATDGALLQGVNNSGSFIESHNSKPLLINSYGSTNVGIGTTSPQAKLDVNGDLRVNVVRITGGADLAEPAHVSDAGLGADAIQPGMVVSIDPTDPGKLILATEAYDRKVAGVISGAGGVQPGMIMKQEGHSIGEGEHPIAMAGRVYVWCDAEANGAIQPGDRLTTSPTPGHAMKATDEGRTPGAVIGKAMTPLAEGRGLVLVLVSLQ